MNHIGLVALKAQIMRFIVQSILLQIALVSIYV